MGRGSHSQKGPRGGGGDRGRGGSNRGRGGGSRGRGGRASFTPHHASNPSFLPSTQAPNGHSSGRGKKRGYGQTFTATRGDPSSVNWRNRASSQGSQTSSIKPSSETQTSSETSMQPSTEETSSKDSPPPHQDKPDDKSPVVKGCKCPHDHATKNAPQIRNLPRPLVVDGQYVYENGQPMYGMIFPPMPGQVARKKRATSTWESGEWIPALKPLPPIKYSKDWREPETGENDDEVLHMPPPWAAAEAESCEK